MIQIVMKPDYDVKPEGGENLYKCLFNGEDVGLRVWGQRASHAEEKMMVIFREQLKGKEVDYDVEAYKKSRGDASKRVDGSEDGEKAETVEPYLPGLQGA